MRISACVIVKNEEKNIRRWLENMQQVADEIIVVDTGSQDATVDIVKEYGVQPYYFQWRNDFAAAKNYAIDQAMGDWILFLDADEYFDAASLPLVRSKLKGYDRNRKIGAIMCQLVNIDVDRHNRVIDCVMQVRIFRNSPRIRYKHPIHEQLVAEGKGYIMQKCHELQILHTGYSSSISRAKSVRNLPILLERQARAKTRQEKEQLYPYLMDVYNSLNEYDKTIEYARKAIAADVRFLGHPGHNYECLISALLGKGAAAGEVLQVIDEAREKLPEEPFFVLGKGHFCYVRGDYIQAEEYLLQGMELRRKSERALREGRSVTDNSLNLVPMMYGELAAIYLRKGRKQQALELALKGLESHKYHDLLVRVLYKALKDRKPVEVIEIFDCLYDRKQDGQYLLQALSWRVSAEFAAYYGGRSQPIEQTRLYLLNGQYQGAAAVSSRELAIAQHALLAGLLARKQAGEAVQGSVCMAVLPKKYAALLEKDDKYDADRAAAERMLAGL